VTNLQRAQQLEIAPALQAYLGFMQGGMLTSTTEAPYRRVSRGQTIEAFIRFHATFRAQQTALVEQYADAAPVVVRREWWELVSK
jgi:hypothetical protein